MESFIDHFYVCEDLSKLGPLDIQRFATLPEAVAAYQALPGGKVKALGAQNTLPRPGSLDFVQHLNGKDWLLSDCLRLPAWRNAEVQKAWSELQRLLPGVQQRTIRFITPEYKDLFTLRDGESLVMRYMDGTTKTTPCFACSDGYHFYLGANQLFHICQFAEISRANGTTYAPANPHGGERGDTYEIYQLSRYSDADYCSNGNTPKTSPSNRWSGPGNSWKSGWKNSIIPNERTMLSPSRNWVWILSWWMKPICSKTSCAFQR